MRFFNKVRSQSLSGTRFKKYVTYAIGEIVLVVVGILIALWINNWNQSQIAQEKQHILAENVLEQMKKDVLEIDKVMAKMDEQEQIYELILMDREPTENEKIIKFKEAPFLVTVGFTILNLEPKVVNQLSNATITDTDMKQTLNAIESDYNLAHNELGLSEEIIVKELLSNLGYLRDNYEWYYKLITGQSLQIDEYAYFKSSDYKNRVAHMELIAMDSYYSNLSKFRTSLQQHIEAVESLVK